MTSKRISVFYPNNPCPPRAGTHRRCLQMLRGLRELGFQVTLLTSNQWADPVWTPAHAAMLRDMTGAEARICPLNRIDQRFLRVILKWQRSRLYRICFSTIPVASYASSPPYLRTWFRRQLEEAEPDAVMMNYAMFDRLLDHRQYRDRNRLLETHDLVSLSFAMRAAIDGALSRIPTDWSVVPDSLLALDYTRQLHLLAAKDEFETMDRYTTTVAICSEESAVIRAATRQTRVATVPVTSAAVPCSNDYRGPALFVTGLNNPFNVHGCLVFAKKVLPHVLQQTPAFQLLLTGDGARRIPAMKGLELVGFVPDISSVYATASFFICPVLAGTGQQIKIVEAMAHGLTVVAWRQRAGDAPIQNGVNGFLCDSPEEFADHSVRLWRDRALCREMGTAARASVAQASGAFLPALQDALLSRG